MQENEYFTYTDTYLFDERDRRTERPTVSLVSNTLVISIKIQQYLNLYLYIVCCMETENFLCNIA